MHKFLSLSTKSLHEKNAKSHQELWQKAQDEGFTGLSLSCDVAITKEVDGDKKTYHAVFSSDTEDRHGEIVFQDFDLKAYKKNPVYLDSHNYDSIEHIIGRVAPLSVKDGKLQGDIEFATDNPKGALAEKLADKGFLNTSSIGFIPKQFDDKGNILKSEMLEISAVSVPANADALYERTAEEVVTPEPAPVEKPEVVGETRDTRATVARTIGDMAAQRSAYLAATARAIAKINEPGAEKRQAFRAVRELMKEVKADIGV